MEVSKPKRTGTPQEDQHSQVTWTLWGSQRLNYQLESKHSLGLGPLHICSRWVAWSSCRSPKELEQDLSLSLLPTNKLPVNVSQVDSLVWTPWERMCLVQPQLDVCGRRVKVVWGVGMGKWNPGGFFHSKRNGWRICMRRYWKKRLWREQAKHSWRQNDSENK